MRRLHLIELEDQEWFPKTIRDGATAFLRGAVEFGGQAQAFVPPLKAALERTGQRELIDVCSGGAGPVPFITRALAAEGLEVTATLSDKYPNLSAFAAMADAGEGRIGFRPGSVDATDMPVDLRGFRTIFNAFHHFPPELATAILADAVRKRQPIGVFEMIERQPLAMAAVVGAPLGVLALMPTLKPHPAWLFWTYLVPAIPALVLWDGLVSCLRVYDPRELRELIAAADPEDSFDWQIERPRMSVVPGHATILIGIPKEMP